MTYKCNCLWDLEEVFTGSIACGCQGLLCPEGASRSDETTTAESSLGPQKYSSLMYFPSSSQFVATMANLLDYNSTGFKTLCKTAGAEGSSIAQAEMNRISKQMSLEDVRALACSDLNHANLIAKSLASPDSLTSEEIHLVTDAQRCSYDENAGTPPFMRIRNERGQDLIGEIRLLVALSRMKPKLYVKATRYQIFAQ